MNRRDFLAASAAPLLLGAANDRKYRTALIGTGWWGMNRDFRFKHLGGTL